MTLIDLGSSLHGLRLGIEVWELLAALSVGMKLKQGCWIELLIRVRTIFSPHCVEPFKTVKRFQFSLLKDYIASLETLDNGKTFENAQGDVDGSVGCLKYFAGEVIVNVSLKQN